MNTDFMKSGIVVPILTPVDKDEKIDEAKLREQVDFVIDGGVVGVLAFGSNGEFYMVEEDEMERALKIMVDQAKGRVPVFMGIGGIATKKCIRIAKMAKEVGCKTMNGLGMMLFQGAAAFEMWTGKEMPIEHMKEVLDIKY